MNTSPAGKGPIEGRLASKMRDMQDRIRNLEHRRVTNVGGWRLEENEQGDLVAHHPSSGVTRIVAMEENSHG